MEIELQIEIGTEIGKGIEIELGMEVGTETKIVIEEGIAI